MAQVKPHQYKGMSYVQHTPKFLQSAMSALRGGAHHDDHDDEDGPHASSSRVPIPERPADDPYRGQESEEEDEFGRTRRRSRSRSRSCSPPRQGGKMDGDVNSEDEMLGANDDAPQVVVLNDGKHLTRDEALAQRNEGTTLGASSSKRTPHAGTLRFATGGNKRKAGTAITSSDDPISVREIKRSKLDEVIKAEIASRKPLTSSSSKTDGGPSVPGKSTSKAPQVKTKMSSSAATAITKAKAETRDEAVSGKGGSVETKKKKGGGDSKSSKEKRKKQPKAGPALSFEDDL